MLKFRIVMVLSIFNALVPYLVIFNYGNPNDWHGIGIILYGIFFPLIAGVILVLFSLFLKSNNTQSTKKNTIITAILSTASILFVLPLLSAISNFMNNLIN